MSACAEVVRYFANYQGYLARSAISKVEIEQLIDSGVSAEELAQRIIDRMEQLEGLRLGYQAVGETKIPVILPDDLRDKHIYVIGKSGYGKTNFLRYLISQDLRAGNGIGVLAPEYEMLRDEILPAIPESRIKDVIYFNPADTEKPVVLNPLHLDPDDDLDLQVDETFTILQRVVGEGGPRMDEILRYSLYALTERQGSSLLDIETLLDRSDSSLRDEVIDTTEDELTRKFFKHTYPQLPKDSHLPIINRLGRFVRARYVRNCLCPPQRTTLSPAEVSKRMLSIRRAMDQGKILLFNLSDGILGEAASSLIGQFVISKFQTATMSRADESKQHRQPFYLYLDEFQNFCGTASQSYERILSRARKYRLGLILAHQQTGQLPTELIREIFGNVSTMISFQVSQPDALKVSREFVFQHDFDVDSIAAEELLRLGVGQAYCKIGRSVFPFSIPRVEDRFDHKRAEVVINHSRDNHGIPREMIDQTETERFAREQGDDPLADIDPGAVFE